MRRSARIAAAALILVLLSSCGGGDDSGDSRAASGKADTAAPPAADSAGAPAEQLGTTNGTSKAPTRGRPPTTDRAIAYVGEVRVEVEDVTAASSSAITQVAGVGGMLSAQQSSLDEDATASLTFKVPPAQFTRLLTSLGRLGRPLGQTVTSEDVTEQLVDLEARLRTAKASADRVRALLGRAGSLAEVVSLEREVANREAEVESMEARLRSLEGRVEDATLTLLLTADDATPIVPDDGERGFLTGLRGGWSAFTTSAVVVATVAGALLPFAAVLALGAVGAVVVRRRRSRTADPAAPAVS